MTDNHIKKLWNMVIDKPVTLFELPDNEDSVLNFARSIGSLLPNNNGHILQPLKMRNKGEGISGTFGNVCGQDAYPWHTDTAFWDEPARFLLLFSCKPSPCATLYLSFDDIFKNLDVQYLIQRAVFLIKHPSYIKCVPFKFTVNGRMGYRYDQHIMSPYNNEAVELDNIIRSRIAELEPQRIIWNGSNMALIDNYSGIHSREESKGDINRQLTRIYIN